MIKRRSFLAMAALAALAACAEPLLDEQVAGSLQVVEVSVDVSQIEKVKGRQIDIGPEQVRDDLRRTLSAYLRDGSLGARRVETAIVVTGISLVSPGQALLVGGSSSIEGLLTVTDVSTGEVILESTAVRGVAKGGYPLGGLIGAAAKASVTPEEDYNATIVGFSQDVRARLFGANS